MTYFFNVVHEYNMIQPYQFINHSTDMVDFYTKFLLRRFPHSKVLFTGSVL